MAYNFYLTPRSLLHLERHFGQGMVAGSYFLNETFPTPHDLLLFLHSATPVSLVEQTPGTSMFTYILTDGRMAGTVGIAKKNTIRESNLRDDIRDGFTIQVGIIEELTFTSDFCIVARKTSQGYSIITAFPGSNARPFPRKGQPPEEYNINKQFWQEHVLLKKRP